MAFNNTDPENWQEIYKDLAELIGKENTLKIFSHYQGLFVTFPMKLFTKDGIENIIMSEYDGHNAVEIARKYRYSLRHVNRIIKGCHEKTEE